MLLGVLWRFGLPVLNLCCCIFRLPHLMRPGVVLERCLHVTLLLCRGFQAVLRCWGCGWLWFLPWFVPLVWSFACVSVDLCCCLDCVVLLGLCYCFSAGFGVVSFPSLLDCDAVCTVFSLTPGVWASVDSSFVLELCCWCEASVFRLMCAPAWTLRLRLSCATVSS